MKLSWVWVVLVCAFGSVRTHGFLETNESEIFYTGAAIAHNDAYFNQSNYINNALMVGLTLIQGAAAKGAGTISNLLFIFLIFIFPF